MALESGPDASGAEVAALAAQGHVRPHGPCVHAEGDGVEAVGPRGRGVGAQGLACLGGAGVRSKLAPMAQVGWMTRRHLDGILNAVVPGATNAAAKSMSARMQRIKGITCGNHNKERFRNAIRLQLGCLDLCLKPVFARTTF